ncbi:MAG TPA: CAP domain-containing protein [Thermoanaerobaculia bacterium]|nr:CAP domain-containing protein [Thermoanaerobaculia bacterium]
MSLSFQRFTALAVALAILFPLSLSAENRTRSRTDLEKLAAELEARLGRGSVVVEGRQTRTSAPAAPSEDAYASAIVAAMNRERAAHGLGPLKLENRLSLAAQDRVDDMLRKRYFDHISPDGVNPFTWVQSRGYRYRLVGENLALGYRTSQSVVTGWMNSPGHRENILKSGFDEVGIAFSESSPMRGYRAPLVVALYGRR